MEKEFRLKIADNNDEYEGLRTLWCEVFSDEPAFVDAMYANFGEDISGYVSLMWKPAHSIVSECPHGTMHACIAMAAQKAMLAFRSVLSLTEQARIVMESAAAAARLSLAGS